MSQPRCDLDPTDQNTNQAQPTLLVQVHPGAEVCPQGMPLPEDQNNSAEYFPVHVLS